MASSLAKCWYRAETDIPHAAPTSVIVEPEVVEQHGGRRQKLGGGVHDPPMFDRRVEALSGRARVS
jgi:hypothetical protein